MYLDTGTVAIKIIAHVFVTIFGTRFYSGKLLKILVFFQQDLKTGIEKYKVFEHMNILSLIILTVNAGRFVFEQVTITFAPGSEVGNTGRGALTEVTGSNPEVRFSRS